MIDYDKINYHISSNGVLKFYTELYVSQKLSIYGFIWNENTCQFNKDLIEDYKELACMKTSIHDSHKKS